MTATEPRRSWLGQSVLRNEDPRFLTGNAQYVDDIRMPGMLEAAMLRSPYAHAMIKKIDYSKALAMPGVHAIITGEDVVPLIEPAHGSTYPAGGDWYYIATDRARFVGEIIAIVAAEDRYIAEDAAEAIEVEYEELPVVFDPERATDPDQSILHPEAPGGNEVMDRVFEFGDVDAAFAEADVVVSERLVVHRHSSTPLEGLAAIASHDPIKGEYTMWVNMGNLGRFAIAARTLRVDQADVRLIVPDVGGSYGVKAWVHQRAVLMAILARKAGRPVKWMEDRLEHLAASHHGTGRTAWMELAAKRDGTILGMKMRTLDDQGAYCAVTEPHGPHLMMATITGPYRFRNLRVECHCVLTNKVPVASNRGYGRVQPVFAVERMVDRLARELNMDAAEIRVKNFIQPESYPYMTPSKALYDSGDPPALMRQLKGLMNYDDMRRQQAEARKQGRLLGIGLAMSVEGGGPTPWDVAEVFIGPDGRLMVQTPTLAQGQGHETTIAQIVGERFDVDPAKIHVTVQLDTRTMTYTNMSGTYASKFSSTGAPAVHGAAKKLADQIAELASDLLDAEPKELVFRDGKVTATVGPERSITLKELAAKVQSSPADFSPGLDLSMHATYYWTWPTLYNEQRGLRGMATFTVVAHGAFVEVDPDTGVVKILKYASSEDCGTILNPMIVDGQIQGGTINGIGWALTEKFVYDETGQLLTGTFMDYLLPRFSDIPPFDIGHVECATPFSPLGSKGVGEGGSIPPMGCISNAVEDAIYHLGGRIVDSHMPPELVLRAIQAGA
ncbi:MAG: Carbon monoxide dehydrogenase [Chloroflexi bacterium]|nr:Carbon monoxide dehydrogenase [Chloroflexota bacterium]